MKQATTIHPRDRQRLGLPELAQPEDLRKSLETNGEPTDHYKAEASRMFNVPYVSVTSEMRRAAKTASFYAHYQ